MNEIITNLMNDWGFNMPSNIFEPMVYIISTLAFCLVFWLISKVVTPGASSMRTFVMKYVCVVMAVVVCLSCITVDGIKINMQNQNGEHGVAYKAYEYVPTLAVLPVAFEEETVQLYNEELTEDTLILLGAYIGSNTPAHDATIKVYINGALLLSQPMVLNDTGSGLLAISASAGDMVVINITTEMSVSEPYPVVFLMFSVIPNTAMINA